ncbi:hypothetical protein L5515_004970 [Caenorhabditis briggsae]|uniref:Uncharacterized protein n=1 Tax=Caenorhabditis briggsae TaxID=6238 RepID=A0AAE9EM59_CAEBR|nr:hypothetical protein L3Y34_002142 [Caenorhabditis briggsae]UMM24984.1 hypothetical protein L5515_004970 [Caenorhabditis briggsae]
MRLRLSSRRLSLKDARSTLNTWLERSHPSTPSRPPPRPTSKPTRDSPRMPRTPSQRNSQSSPDSSRTRRFKPWLDNTSTR